MIAAIIDEELAARITRSSSMSGDRE